MSTTSDGHLLSSDGDLLLSKMMRTSDALLLRPHSTPCSTSVTTFSDALPSRMTALMPYWPSPLVNATRRQHGSVFFLSAFRVFCVKSCQQLGSGPNFF
jgi:hypothetical protein